jgi:hypothetical protein
MAVQWLCALITTNEDSKFKFEKQLLADVVLKTRKSISARGGHREQRHPRAHGSGCPPSKGLGMGSTIIDDDHQIHHSCGRYSSRFFAVLFDFLLEIGAFFQG